MENFYFILFPISTARSAAASTARAGRLGKATRGAQRASTLPTPETPCPGSAHRPEAPGAMGTDPSHAATGPGRPQGRAPSLRSPKPAAPARGGGAVVHPDRGAGRRQQREGHLLLVQQCGIYSEFGNTTPNVSSLGFLLGAGGEGVVGRKEILAGLWGTCSLFPGEE